MATDLDLQIAQLFLAGVPGTELTEEWRESLARYPFGGVHLCDWNLDGPAQTAALIQEISNAIRERGVTETPLIALDHEGGSLTPLRRGEATNLPGLMALGATGEPKLVREVGRMMGEELTRLGFNLNWAPVLDLNANPRNPVIGIRSFGDQPRQVVELGLALIQGMQEGGVAATAKHFPGHGDTEVDSHHGLPLVEADLASLESSHLIPFGAAAAAGVDAIMTAHILLPQIAGSPLDPEGRHKELPATLNPAILDRLLRRHLGFDGVIVTDALEMWGIQGRWPIEEAAVMALEAGADIPLVVFDHQARERAFLAVKEAVESGRISRERLAESVARVTALRARIVTRRFEMGLPPQIGPGESSPSPAEASPNFDLVGHQEMLAQHSERVAEIARQAVVAGEGFSPIPPGTRLLVVTPIQENLTPADTTGGQPVLLGEALQKLGYSPQVIMLLLTPSEAELEAVLAAAQGEVDQILLGTINAWRFPEQVAVIRALEGLGKPVTGIALRDPYDWALFPASFARLATCSTEPVMMTALAEVLAGLSPAEGRLPVQLGS